MNERHKERHNGVHCSKLKLATSEISSTTSYLVVPILCKKDAPETPCALGRGWTFQWHASLGMAHQEHADLVRQTCVHPIMWLTLNLPLHNATPFRTHCILCSDLWEQQLVRTPLNQEIHGQDDILASCRL